MDKKRHDDLFGAAEQLEGSHRKYNLSSCYICLEGFKFTFAPGVFICFDIPSNLFSVLECTSIKATTPK